MTIGGFAAVGATVLLAMLVLFQLLLALGAPLGRAAWGGAERVLPPRLRYASAAAIPVLAIAIWLVLSGAGLVSPTPAPVGVRVGVWFFAAYFAFNTVMNVRSNSVLERRLMTPVALLLSAAFLIVALF